jgi:HAD superfamily hydrolase (TIGR01509 family)
MNRALIFDCDGVLGDTEQHGHLVAFNQMWRELGVPWQWSIQQYGEKLKIGGGKERMASLFQDPAFTSVFPVPVDESARKALLATWHQRKSAIFRELVNSGRIPPRPGVQRLAEEALAQGWKLAVASTSAAESVEAMLRHAVGDATFGRFEAVLAGDVVPNKKPAPDIYLLAAEKLGTAPADCIVVEDSNNGLRAALAAGMKCIVTVSGFTQDEDFTGAALVLSCLGDPDGDVCEVIVNRSLAKPEAYLTADDLEAVAAASFRSA